MGISPQNVRQATSTAKDRVHIEYVGTYVGPPLSGSQVLELPHKHYGQTAWDWRVPVRISPRTSPGYVDESFRQNLS